MQLQKLLCEYVYSLRMAKSQGSFKADEHHIVSTVDCASLDISMIVVFKIFELYSNLQIGRKSDLPEDLVCYRKSPP